MIINHSACYGPFSSRTRQVCPDFGKAVLKPRTLSRADVLLVACIIVQQMMTTVAGSPGGCLARRATDAERNTLTVVCEHGQWRKRAQNRTNQDRNSLQDPASSRIWAREQTFCVSFAICYMYIIMLIRLTSCSSYTHECNSTWLFLKLLKPYCLWCGAPC